MTLRDTTRSFLQTLLDWAKANRDYWGKIKDTQDEQLAFNWNFVQYRFNRFVHKVKRGFRGDDE